MIFCARSRGASPRKSANPCSVATTSTSCSVGRVWHHRYDLRNRAAFAYRWADENRDKGIARKVPRATNPVHHARAADVGGVDVAVDVKFNRGVNADDAETTNDFGEITHVLRTQNNFVLVLVKIVDEIVVAFSEKSPMDVVEANFILPESINSKVESCNTSEYITKSSKSLCTKPESTALAILPIPACSGMRDLVKRPSATSLLKKVRDVF